MGSSVLPIFGYWQAQRFVGPQWFEQSMLIGSINCDQIKATYLFEIVLLFI